MPLMAFSLKLIPNELQKYLVREHEETIYASSDYAHMAGPGDVNTGRAWRTVRRPSDMVCALVGPFSNHNLPLLYRMNMRNKYENTDLRRIRARHTGRFLCEVQALHYVHLQILTPFQCWVLKVSMCLCHTSQLSLPAP